MGWALEVEGLGVRLESCFMPQGRQVLVGVLRDSELCKLLVFADIGLRLAAAQVAGLSASKGLARGIRYVITAGDVSKP